MYKKEFSFEFYADLLATFDGERIVEGVANILVFYFDQ